MGVINISPKKSSNTFKKCSTCEAVFEVKNIQICNQCGGSQFVTIIKPGKKLADASIVKDLVALLIFGLPSFGTSILLLILGFIIFFVPFFWAIGTLVWAIIGLIINSINFDQRKSKLSIQNISVALHCFAIVFCIITIIITFTGTFVSPF